METRHVTLLMGDNKRAWQHDEMQYIAYALKDLGVHCLTCWNYQYPDVFVLVANNLGDNLADVVSPLDIKYKIIDIDMESSVQDQSIKMVREICYPVFGLFTRAPAA